MLVLDTDHLTEFQKGKIASICLANDATLLSRNRKDFDKVPGLRVEDWLS